MRDYIQNMGVTEEMLEDLFNSTMSIADMSIGLCNMMRESYQGTRHLTDVPLGSLHCGRFKKPSCGQICCFATANSMF